MKFIITVDTEADNQWKENDKISYENIFYLERWQEFCEKFNFPVTYLVTYDVATNIDAVEEICKFVKNSKIEIGAHHHAWTTKPLLKNNDNKYLFATELDTITLRKQLDNLTQEIEKKFGKRPTSFRGGRWSFDLRMEEYLTTLGYTVDSSVTPKINWSNKITKGNRAFAPNYLNAPVEPYYLSTSGIDKAGHRKLLEVPITILYTKNYINEKGKFHNLIHKLPNNLLKYGQGFAKLKWLRVFPETESQGLVALYNVAKNINLSCLVFMIHSSELMPGGSPASKTIDDVEHIYKVLEEFFQYLKKEETQGITLSDFARFFKNN